MIRCPCAMKGLPDCGACTPNERALAELEARLSPVGVMKRAKAIADLAQTNPDVPRDLKEMATRIGRILEAADEEQPRAEEEPADG